MNTTTDSKTADTAHLGIGAVIGRNSLNITSECKKIRRKIYYRLKKNNSNVFMGFWYEKYRLEIGISTYDNKGNGCHYKTIVKGKTVEKRLNNLIKDLNYFYDLNIPLYVL